MLKFLTHKLRTHSLNEENVSEKVEERDSGTESDDEADRADTGDFCTDVIMKWNDVTDISMSGESCPCGRAPSPPLPAPPHAPAPAPAPHHPPHHPHPHPHPHPHHHPHPDHLYDHHSSEEELEVINGAPSAVRLASGAGAVEGAGGGGAGGAGEAARAQELGGGGGGGAAPAAESRRRGASSPPAAHPEKRKWPAQPYHHHHHHHHHSTDIDADLETDDLAARPASDDDDDTKIETPVRFRTSPPLEALKVRGGGGGAGGGGGGGGAGCSCAPSSPRRRRLPLPPPRRHRPALDFDKMQQLKVGGGGVRSWRAVGGAHGGELSVFCW